MTPRQSGFTLTEALVALVVMAILSVALLGAVRSAVMAQAGVTRGVGNTEARALLNETLRDVLRYSYRGPGTDHRFSGDQYGFRVLTQPPGRLAPMIASVTLGDDGVSLSLADLATGQGDRVAVLTGAEQVRLRYFSPGDDGGEYWFETWGEDFPPALVRVDFLDENGDDWRIEVLVGGMGDFDCPFDRTHGVCLDTRSADD